MVLRPLTPPPKVGLMQGWELIASEAGRTGQGTRSSVHLFNGQPQATQTIVLGDPKAQSQLCVAFAAIVQLPEDAIRGALAQLATAVEEALRGQGDTDSDDKPSQATRLVAMALNTGVELFHTPDGEAFASIAVDGHTETWPLRVKGFRRWLARQFYEAEDKTPGSQALQDALGVLEGKALFAGPERPVCVRLAEQNGAIYLDLANEHWQAVEITPSGWHVVDDPPVKFRRARGMLPLPGPVAGGTIEQLREFVNVESENEWRLVVSYLLATLRPTGPYPVLVVHGEQGSAKSTVTRVLRALADPNQAALRTTPRDERDLVIAATNGWLIALDNLSHLPPWLSDALCRLATGSGFATRELYSDAEETIFAAQRPIVMNGIEELATRGDLLDRAILLYLPTIPETKRQQEADFWRCFDTARPQLLGALLDVVSHAMQALPAVELPAWPRMADFARWAYAAAPACAWTGDDFLAAYTGNREEARDLTLEASPVAPVLRDFVASKRDWTDTASQLLAELATLAGEQTTRQKAWPKSGRALSGILRRLAPALRASGVKITFDIREAGTGKRQLQVARIEDQDERHKERATEIF